MKLQLVAKKPSYKDYPTELTTLGNHLRKARLDKDLSQTQVAEILGVVTDTVTCWELNRNEPSSKFAGKILKFIGYIPKDWTDNLLHLQLHYARISIGLSQLQLANKLNIDASNLSKIEKGCRYPQTKIKMKIESFVKTVFLLLILLP